ncbi:MAG: hypothetical protein J6N19_04920 [Clostridium sp.]|nr:hypothetical protein [Clostridium sp.]
MTTPDGLSRTEIEKAIQEWIVGRHAERDRRIFARRILDGITYNELAYEFSLSPRQIANIVYRCESIIYPRLLYM